MVKEYPKDKEYRRLKLSPQIIAKLKAHIKAHKLGLDALLFARRTAAPVPLHMIIESGMEGGMQEAFDKLEEVAKSLQ